MREYVRIYLDIFRLYMSICQWDFPTASMTSILRSQNDPHRENIIHS